jgi:hypothetical protein
MTRRELLGAVASASLAQAADMPKPRAGRVDILPIGQVKKGMQATAWTVFEGTEPEAVPIEIIGVWKNAWGPKQDIILGKMGGKAQRTNVAGGMSGSPVYIDGKMMGAVSLRLSVFSPDAICGITPIELMLEINDYDQTRPSDARVPQGGSQQARLPLPQEYQQVMSAPYMVPIETPLTMSGFHTEVLTQFGPMFRQMGLNPVQGGASAALHAAKPALGWEQALQPGEAIAGVLVSGDMSMTGLGTVTYNDGKRVLGFGHSFFNLGPVSMPMSKGEVLMVLSSAFQPNKFANATEIVGALRQDRHSGIMGVLGEESRMIPVSVKVNTLGDAGNAVKNKVLNFNVFVQQKWTPYLMMVTLFNSISGMNDFAEDTTYRLKGLVELGGGQKLDLSTMQSPSEAPVPASMQLAGWWGDKFNRLFLNQISVPDLKRVDVSVDLIPERRSATIESAWLPVSEVEPGAELPVKVYLRPYRGGRLEREIKLQLPKSMAGGQYRVVLSDADTLNRMQNIAGQMNRFLDVPEIVSLISQERPNNRLYASLVQSRPTMYVDDKTMPNLPSSVLNVMQNGRSSARSYLATPETALAEVSIPFDYMVSGSHSLRVTVK